jgi:twitching motility protein PilI
MAEVSAFELMQGIADEASKVLANADFVRATATASTKNVAFRVRDLNLFCDSSYIAEVSAGQSILPVPLTKQWVRGVINAKGRLYSVADIALFAGLDRPIREDQGHLLLLNDREKQSALLVSKVIGFRYFDEADRQESAEIEAGDVEGLADFIDEKYHAEGEDWFHLDVQSMLRSARFTEVQ